MSSPAPTLPVPVDGPRLARTDVCPHCGALLAGPACPRCGIELVGPTAVRLLEASRQADRWLGERSRLVQVLRAETALRQHERRQRVAALPPSSRPPTTQGPQVPQPSAAPPRRSVLSVQSLLVGLGALLLAVASVVFLAFSWDQLGITGRSLVVAAMTLAVLGAALLARRARMVLTAEAVGALGAVLVLLDAVAVRVTGLAGDGMGRLTYGATAAAVCVLVLAAVGRLGRLHSLGTAAAALAPLVPLLLGLHLALRAEGGTAVTWTATGLLAASATGLAGGLLAARGARVEGGVLTWVGAAAAGSAALLLPVLAVVEPWHGATLASGGAVLGLAHTLVPERRAARTWSGVAGACTAAAVALLAVHVLDTWALLGAPMGVGLVALALRQVAAERATGPHLLVASRAALSVLGVAAFPAALVVLVHPLGVAGVLVESWSARLATAWGAAAGLTQDWWLPGTERTASFVAVLAVAGVLAGWWRVSGSPLARSGAALVVAVLVVCLPWQLDLTVLHVVATALLLAVGASAAGHLLRRRPGWVVEGTIQLAAGAVVGTLGVLAAWYVEPLSLPVTLVGVAGLVLARRASGQAVLDVPAVASCLVVAGGVLAWTGAPVADAVLLGALAGAVAVLGASLVARLAVPDRRAVAGTGAVAVLVAVIPAVASSGAARDLRLLLVLLAASLVAAAPAIDPRRVWSGAERAAGTGLLVPVLGLAATQAVRVAQQQTWGGAVDGLDPALAAAVVVASALAACATMRRNGSPLAVAAEIGAVVAGSVVLVVAVAGLAGLRDQPSWPLLVASAVGVAALATAPGRRPVAWVALVLASGALWDRLAAADVGVIEAFSVPPAIALLVAGVVTTRRDGVVTRPSTVTGLAVLVLPTAVAAVGGPVWRPVVLLVAAAAAVAVAHRVVGARREVAALLVVASATGVLAGPALRSLAGGGRVAEVEPWSVPAALVLLGIALVLPRVWGRAGSLISWRAVPALVVAVVPSLAYGDVGPGPALLARHLLPLLVAGAVLALAARAERVRTLGWTALALLAVVVLAGTVRDVPGPVEALTVPAALALLLAGQARMSRVPALGSWPWLGPACTLALVPSLVLATTQGPVPRTALLAVGAAAVLVAGVQRRWQAPVLVGAGVLVVHAVVQLSPWVALAYQAVPRWASLALVGLVLLALGARYEARVRDVVSLRRRVATLR